MAATSGEEKELLEAIKLDENNDAREVYADWLEEHGQIERAEYLRLEIELRSYEFVTGDPEREAKKQRFEVLARTCDLPWLAIVQRPPPIRVHERGPRVIVTPSSPTPRPSQQPVTALRADLFPVRSPVEVGRGLPPLQNESPRRLSWRTTIVLGLILGIALILFTNDVQKPGFWDRLLWRLFHENGGRMPGN